MILDQIELIKSHEIIKGVEVNIESALPFITKVNHLPLYQQATKNIFLSLEKRLDKKNLS